MTSIVPVVDILNGAAVRAIGGRRNEYRPITSQLTSSSNPLEVAKVLLDYTRAESLYVADLDAILQRQTSNWARHFSEAFPQTRILFDAGLRSSENRPNETRENLRPIFATETLDGPRSAQRIRNEVEQPVFSLDVLGGRLLGNWQSWASYGIATAEAVREFAIVLAREFAAVLILLDLSSVGEKRGASQSIADIVRAVKEVQPEVEVVTGGGIRNWHDVDRCGECGADSVLVSTAMHERTLLFPRQV